MEKAIKNATCAIFGIIIGRITTAINRENQCDYPYIFFIMVLSIFTLCGYFQSKRTTENKPSLKVVGGSANPGSSQANILKIITS